MKRLKRLGGPVEMIQPSAVIGTGDEVNLPDDAANAQLDRNPSEWKLISPTLPKAKEDANV